MFHPVISTPKQSDFLAIPGSPIVYWWSFKFLQLFHSDNTKNSKVMVSEGLGTRQDSRFVRFFWENKDITRWSSYSKGGGYARWAGNDFWVVEWHENGCRVKSYISDHYPPEKFNLLIRHEILFGKAKLVYSTAGRGSIGVRETKGIIPGDVGPAIFYDEMVDFFDHYSIMSFLNGRVSSYILRGLAAGGINLKGFYISMLPTKVVKKLSCVCKDIARFCVILKSHLLTFKSNEHDFGGDIAFQSKFDAVAAVLHALEGINEREVFAAYGVAGDDMAAVLDETGTPAGFHPLLAGYDALPELPAELELPALPGEVLEYLAAHERISPAPAELARLKARLRALYEAGPGAKEEDDAPASDVEGGADDEGEGALSGAHIPIPTETFLEELSVKIELHPISVYRLLEELRAEGARCKPEERRLLEDRLSVLVLRLLGHRWPRQIEAGESAPEWADPDGIIPLGAVAGHSGLAERVRARLRAEDGDLGMQRAEALLVELTGHSLEDWLRREFFKRHTRQFKYRPVAWHLASDQAVAVAAADGKTRKRLGGRRQPAFECIVYYHACGGDLLARLRTQYVEPLLRAARQQLEQAARAADEAGAVQATMRIQELEEFARRLLHVAERGFACPELDTLLAAEPLDRWSGDGYLAPAGQGELLRQEQGWRVDLNDGVRVNIAPVQQAGLLAADVLKAADAKKAITDRARWRADERRWVRAGKLPRCGWLPESVPESPEWTRLAPQRAAEQAKLEEKRRAALARAGDQDKE